MSSKGDLGGDEAHETENDFGYFDITTKISSPDGGTTWYYSNGRTSPLNASWNTSITVNLNTKRIV
jgi:hypothetical protein